MAPTATQEELIALLAPRLDGLTTRAAERAVSELPEYRDIDVEEIRGGILRDLTLAMAALGGGRELSEEDLVDMGDIGRSRARQGIPIQSMLGVYRFTIDEVFGELWDAADGGSFSPTEILNLTRSAWGYAGPMLEVAVAAYRAEEIEIAVADSERRTALVHSVLFTGGKLDVAPLVAAGIDPRSTFVAFRARRLDGDFRRLLLDLKLPGCLDGGMAAPYEQDVIGFAPAAPGLANDPETIVGIGTEGRLGDMPRSLQFASRMVDAAATYGRLGKFGVGSLALEVIARSEDDLGQALVDQYLTPLEPLSPAGAELVRSIVSFLDNDLNADAAAEELFVHPNTVRNRLRRFEELTGKSLRSIQDLSELQIALLRLRGGAPEADA
ncbi:MAG: helix-turn-helix domain-containing protein [Thermoleophilaceae bacterium]|nr:helix-turn-helix domain-containing protein [Thermoleophilaceae bacterium]